MRKYLIYLDILAWSQGTNANTDCVLDAAERHRLVITFSGGRMPIMPVHQYE